MVTYNKVYKKSDGRKLVASGPRNSQTRLARQSQSVLEDTSPEELSKLRENIEILTNQINHSAGYNKEQVDDMVNTAIEDVTADLEKSYIKEINSLKSLANERLDRINKLEEQVDSKDKIIEKLTSSIGTGQVIVQSTDDIVPSDSARPSIDSVFVDPTQKGEEDRFESHVEVEEVKPKEKTNVGSSVNKLRELMGSKLPKV